MKIKNLNIFFILGLFLLVSGFTIQAAISSGTEPPSDYKKQWLEAQKLEKQGKPRSALEVVNIIFELAKSDKNDVQMIKSIEYSIRLKSRFEEGYIQKSIVRIQTELPNFSPPSTQVLHALLADLYLGFYSANRHLILSRTSVVEYELTDIETWDQKLFAEKIFDEFSKSLEDPGLLQNTAIATYADILTDTDSLDIFRPTLYDILAHNALDFYKNDEFMASRPALRFEVDDQQMLDIASAFVKLKLQQKEEYSMKFHALKLYQNLIAFHLKDEDPAALVDLDLKRLKFVADYAIFEEKEKVFLHTLEQMEAFYIGKEPVTEVYYHLATLYNISGQIFNPLVSDEHQRDRIIAAQYCENAMKEFPASYGAKLCKNLLKTITKKLILCIHDYANIPGKPILSSLSFTNVSTIYLRIIPLDPAEDRGQRRSRIEDQLLLQYRQVRPVKHWSVELPVEVDHNTHTTEIAIPLLPEGYYGFMVSDNPAFEKSNGVIHINNFWVTGISYISNKKDNGDLMFYVLDRLTGKQLPGVNIQLYEEVYDNRIREYKLVKQDLYTSDAMGSFIIPAYEGHSNRLILDFTTGDDQFTSPGFFYSSKTYHRPYVGVNASYFFTDRSIYRPGQTIYFKGILLDRTGESYEIRKNEATTVQLYDVNNQKISELELQSNEYGSVNGSFTAPIGGLTGSMRIQNKSGSVSISVEEYKRPKFEVVFDPVKGSYKLDEEITVTGKAMAYSGNTVDHASVKYRIVRNIYYPYRYYWRAYYPRFMPVEIGFGELETNESGEFNIVFTAISDRSQYNGSRPVFTYTVYADITDISGETHSGQKTVSVGEKSLLIDLDIPEHVNADETESFTLNTTNLNGEAEPAEVAVKITQLQPPESILIERGWERPDVFLLTEDKFREMFPGRVYKDENDKSGWKEIKTLFDEDIDTKEETSIRFEKFSRWQPGEYKVEMKAEDVFGEEVIVIKYFTLYSPSSPKLPMNLANWFVPLNTSGEPGEKVSFLIGTAYKDVRVLYEVSGKNELLKHEWVELSNEQRLMEIPIREEDRGGLGVSFIFVHSNKSYSNTQNIEVPYTNKKLNISFETFRDKLLPGQKESWKIKIRSHEGEKVAAEMLAGMYDESLDAIKPHGWNFNLFKFHYSPKPWNVNNAFDKHQGRSFQDYEPYKNPPERIYSKLIWNGLYRRGFMYPGLIRGQQFDGAVMSADGEVNIIDYKLAEATTAEEIIVIDKDRGIPPLPLPGQDKESIPIRRNLQETAFFFPNLNTNADGDVIISFTMPESLTRWKMMGLAYTQDLKSGTITKELVTKKDLMIIPNQPRFFREGDEIWFSAKVVNMSEKELKGEATLQLFDAISMKPVDGIFGNDDDVIEFTASEGNSSHVNWKLNIPENVGPVLYRVIARAGNYSDGEEMVIPVLKNRMLVTESMPLPINGNETKNFVFEKLANSQTEGSTLNNYSYTLEFTSNPAWYAVQALPYLMEYPYECSEQIFNRVYANGFASHIVNQHPKIKTVFESWVNETPDALLSKLEKNQDLKNVLLEETPWVMQAKNESERKKRIALLFDLNRMENELSVAISRLRQNQMINGGWPWFAGGPDNKYITQYILTGFGKMQHLGVLDKEDVTVRNIVRDAIRYADERMFEEFMRIKDKNVDYQKNNYLNRSHVQYLYSRSFFMEDYYLLEKHKEGFLYFKDQVKKYWTDYDKFLQGMIALSLHRMGDKPQPAMIMASIKEHALYDDEMGMYWRQNAGYYWYEAPIETQALLIEAFDEVLDDQASVELMKTWLLKQKQTQDWKTTKATADACYALLLRGVNLIAEEGDVSIEVGGETINPDELDGVKKEAGTGYFRHHWSGKEIGAEMANISITKLNDGVAWGAVYWQYFEDLDKITPHLSPLSIQKKLFVETNTSEGPVLTPINDGDVLKPGDKVVSRIEIRADRDMEFVHLKDMRAAALEPRNVLSGYHWQGGMGYYESIRDASVNFFFSYLRKGTWIFEYPLNVTQKGTFSNGISTIQCMYAPEFASHSEGVRVRVE